LLDRLDFFVRGIVIGFSIAAPVGPIGVLCIQRTLTRGRMAGLVSGLGAATADALYGSVAAFGLTYISSALIGGQAWLRIVGGLLLCFLGLRALFSKVRMEATNHKRTVLPGNYASTFLLTLTNPMTILSFTVIYAALGLGDTQSGYLSAAIMVLGVFLGSALWWLSLSTGVAWLGSKVDAGILVWINRLSALIILGFGIFALLSGWSAR
jgi:threonine/homoserine/homoserine lactone efflux protein